MQVRTRMLPATNNRGTRIKATVMGADTAVSVTVPYDYDISALDNHQNAAVTALMRVADERSVRGQWGAVDDHERGYIFVKMAQVTPCFELVGLT